MIFVRIGIRDPLQMSGVLNTASYSTNPIYRTTKRRPLNIHQNPQSKFGKTIEIFGATPEI